MSKILLTCSYPGCQKWVELPSDWRSPSGQTVEEWFESVGKRCRDHRGVQPPRDEFEAPDPLAQVEGYRDGDTYETVFDFDRLNAQARRVFVFMADEQWHTLAEIAKGTGDPEASVSARLRDLRKQRFGKLTVDRERVGAGRGQHQYRIHLPSGMTLADVQSAAAALS